MCEQHNSPDPDTTTAKPQSTKQRVLERAMRIAEQGERLGTPEADVLEEHQEWPEP